MFQSILFQETGETASQETLEAPEFFRDLNLDQIIDAITAGKQEYNLKPLFYKALHDVGAIKYRQEIASDLENETLLKGIKSFGLQMATVRRDLAMTQKLEYTLHREGWYLETVNNYCDAVNCLTQSLNLADLKSGGLLSFREYLNAYSNSSLYQSLLQDTKKLKADLSTVKYCLHIERFRVRVRKYQSETDYSQEVAETFEKFKQGNSRDYRNERFFKSGMNPLQAEILHYVARLYPEIFSNLARYCAQYINFVDAAISLFDREVQFYIAYLDFIAGIKKTGQSFCYPQIVNDSKEIHCHGGFDLALAYKCLQEKSALVCNDFYLQGKESIFIVSGPDQGGKATFARTFGQLHYLASLGCSVPGREARLLMWDKLLVLSEKEESIEDLRSKLEDDLIRIHSALDQATSHSIIIINKILASTTLQDNIILSRKIAERIANLEALCVWVTPLGELGSFSEKTVSMISTVDPENPAVRTYKILRRPADDLSYAISIAEKYSVTYECLKERIKP